MRLLPVAGPNEEPQRVPHVTKMFAVEQEWTFLLRRALDDNATSPKYIVMHIACSPTVTVLLRAMTVGKWVRDELSRVHAPPGGDTSSHVGNLMRKRSKKAVHTESIAMSRSQERRFSLLGA